MARLRWVLLTVGMGLLVVNLIGLFVPLRNPAIYTEPANNFEHDISLTEEEFLAIVHAPAATSADRLRQLTLAVAQGIAHYWDDSGISKYNLRVPVQENYWLWAASWLYPAGFQKYEFFQYEKAVARGVGLCSQHALILLELLHELGFEASLIPLHGHVVVTAAVQPGQWWTLDPDYGVILPYTIATLSHHPERVEQYYQAAGHAPALSTELARIYSAPAPAQIDALAHYSLRYYFERVTYVLKWVVPLLLLLGAWRLHPQPVFLRSAAIRRHPSCKIFFALFRR